MLGHLSLWGHSGLLQSTVGHLCLWDLFSLLAPVFLWPQWPPQPLYRGRLSLLGLWAPRPLLTSLYSLWALYCLRTLLS